MQPQVTNEDSVSAFPREVSCGPDGPTKAIVVSSVSEPTLPSAEGQSSLTVPNEVLHARSPVANQQAERPVKDSEQTFAQQLASASKDAPKHWAENMLEQLQALCLEEAGRGQNTVTWESALPGRGPFVRQAARELAGMVEALGLEKIEWWTGKEWRCRQGRFHIIHDSIADKYKLKLRVRWPDHSPTASFHDLAVGNCCLSIKASECTDVRRIAEQLQQTLDLQRQFLEVGRATQVLALSCKTTRDRASDAARMVRTDRGRGSQASSSYDVRQGVQGRPASLDRAGVSDHVGGSSADHEPLGVDESPAFTPQTSPVGLSPELQGRTQCHGMNGWSFAVPPTCPPDAVEASVSQEASVKSGGGTMLPCEDDSCVGDSCASPVPAHVSVSSTRGRSSSARQGLGSFNPDELLEMSARRRENSRDGVPRATSEFLLPELHEHQRKREVAGGDFTGFPMSEPLGSLESTAGSVVSALRKARFGANGVGAGARLAAARLTAQESSPASCSGTATRSQSLGPSDTATPPAPLRSSSCGPPRSSSCGPPRSPRCGADIPKTMAFPVAKESIAALMRRASAAADGAAAVSTQAAAALVYPIDGLAAWVRGSVDAEAAVAVQLSESLPAPESGSLPVESGSRGTSALAHWVWPTRTREEIFNGSAPPTANSIAAWMRFGADDSSANAAAATSERFPGVGAPAMQPGVAIGTELLSHGPEVSLAETDDECTVAFGSFGDGHDQVVVSSPMSHAAETHQADVVGSHRLQITFSENIVSRPRASCQ